MQDRRRLVLATMLVAIAGWVDATGYLHFARFFVSFMSGNSTVFGIQLAYGEWRAAGPVLVAIASFVFGAFLSGLAEETLGGWRIPLLLLLEAALLTLALAAASTYGIRAVSVSALAMAMGAQNSVLRRVGGASVSLTFVTGTLVRLGRSLAAALFGREAGSLWKIYAVMWVALAAGACAGALVYSFIGFEAIAVPLFALLAIAVEEGMRTFRRKPSRRRPSG